MKYLLMIITLLFAGNAFAATCTPISRSNVSANAVLTSTEYNNSLNTAYSAINSFDGGCLAAGSIDDEDSFSSSVFGAMLNGVKEGCVVSNTDTNTLSIGKCMIAVNGAFVKTTTATTRTWGESGDAAEAASTVYYLYAKTGSSGTTLIPLISTTAPNADGYDNSGNRILASFVNDFSSNITTVLNARQGNVFEDNWFVDVNISGANISAGTSAQTTYVGLSDTALTLTANTGSATAWIPCTTTNAPSGTTCSSGDEMPGVSFIVPQSGTVEVCAEFAHRMGLGATASAGITFQLVNTPSNAQTISAEGKSRVEYFSSNATGGGTSQGAPMHVCGHFTASSAAQMTFRLFYEQRVESGAITSSEIMADAGASNGQRDIHIYARPVKH